MSFDPITLDEVRRQAEATRADVAALSAAVQGLSVIKKVQRGVVTTTSLAEVVITVSAVDVNKAFLNILTLNQKSNYARDMHFVIHARIISSTSIGISAYSEVIGYGSYQHPVSWELVEFK